MDTTNGLGLLPQPAQCTECGGWTRDPWFHSERYQHEFSAR